MKHIHMIVTAFSVQTVTTMMNPEPMQSTTEPRSFGGMITTTIETTLGTLRDEFFFLRETPE